MEWATDRLVNFPLAGSAYKSHSTLSDIARRLHCLTKEQGWQLFGEDRVLGT